jgi:hypothetical protein
MSICNQYGVICKNKITEQYGIHFTESITVCTGQRQMGGFYELNTVRFSNFVFFFIYNYHSNILLQQMSVCHPHHFVTLRFHCF